MKEMHESLEFQGAGGTAMMVALFQSRLVMDQIGFLSKVIPMK